MTVVPIDFSRSKTKLTTKVLGDYFVLDYMSIATVMRRVLFGGQDINPEFEALVDDAATEKHLALYQTTGTEEPDAGDDETAQEGAVAEGDAPHSAHEGDLENKILPQDSEEDKAALKRAARTFNSACNVLFGLRGESSIAGALEHIQRMIETARAEEEGIPSYESFRTVVQPRRERLQKPQVTLKRLSNDSYPVLKGFHSMRTLV